MFYCPNHSMRIAETGNLRFIENGEISRSTVPREVEIKEVRVQVLLVCASSSKVIASFSCCCYKINEEEQHNNEPMIHNEPIMEEPQEVVLRRSQSEKETNYFE